MTHAVRTLVIRPDGRASIERHVPDLDSMKALVGGWLEIITPSSGAGTWHAYVDEEGKLKNSPINHAANLVLTRLGWQGLAVGDFVVGTVVILGTDGTEESDVPEEVLAVVKSLYAPTSVRDWQDARLSDGEQDGESTKCVAADARSAGSHPGPLVAPARRFRPRVAPTAGTPQEPCLATTADTSAAPSITCDQLCQAT